MDSPGSKHRSMLQQPPLNCRHIFVCCIGDTGSHGADQMHGTTQGSILVGRYARRVDEWVLPPEARHEFCRMSMVWRWCFSSSLGLKTLARNSVTPQRVAMSPHCGHRRLVRAEDAPLQGIYAGCGRPPAPIRYGFDFHCVQTKDM